ncbi:MAG: M28 family peptidase, partial [Fibrella sp.]|nr:M28 family peptidase [Armatimonadota bacterium]
TVSALKPLLADLLKETGATEIETGGGGADISPLLTRGVPGGELTNDMTMYWQIHHTPADTMDKINPKEFKQCIAALAVLSYVVAEMPERLPSGKGR